MKDSPYLEDEDVTDPLESRWFYEMCQQYRHANPWPQGPNGEMPSAGDAFEELKRWISGQFTCKTTT